MGKIKMKVQKVYINTGDIWTDKCKECEHFGVALGIKTRHYICTMKENYKNCTAFVERYLNDK